MTTPEPLTPEQTISFLLSVIASGERLTDAEVEAAREAARALRTPAEPGLRGTIRIRTPDDQPGDWTAKSDLLPGTPYTYSSGDVAVMVDWFPTARPEPGLREALVRFRASHRTDCISTTLGPDDRCTCGLSAALGEP